MKAKKSSASLIRLLEPHARPYLWALLLVVFLGGLSALGQRSVYLLLEPTWDVLFPDRDRGEAVGPARLLPSRGAEGSAPADDAATEAGAAEPGGAAEQDGTAVPDATGAAGADLAESDEIATPGSSESDEIATPSSGAAEGTATPGSGEPDEAPTPGSGEPDGTAAPAAGARDGTRVAPEVVTSVLDRIDAWLAVTRERAIEAVIGPRAELDPARPMGPLLRIVGVVAVIAIVTAVVQYAFLWLSRWASLRMVVGLRLRLARHLMGLSVRYHGTRSFGDLLSRVSADVGTTLNVVQLSLRDLVQQPLLALASLAGAFYIAPRAATFVLVGLPVLALPLAVFARRVRKTSTKSLNKLGASVQVLAQMFQGVRTVKAFRGEEREIERYREINESYVRNSMRMVRAIALSSAWTTLFSFVGLGLLILLVGWMSTRSPEMRDPGKMATFFLLIASVYTSVKTTTKTITRAQESIGASVRLLEILAQPADIVEKPGAHAIEGLGTGLVLDHVTFTYPGADAPAVHDLRLAIRPGETLALVGPSGAGKSTVMDLVARFVDPDGGRVTAGGTDLRELTLDSWTAQYAMVGQVPFLFHATIEENVRYGKPGASHEEVVAAARAAGILDFVESLPQGWATSVADAGSRLSGGQRQRITIARAFLKGAPLLLLDEATSALDAESEAVVQEALARLMQDRTVIVIAHRLSTIRSADRIAVLERGRLVEIGSHDELLAQGGAYARMHAAQHPVEAPAG